VTFYPDLELILEAATIELGGGAIVRDYGLLQAAIYRPQTTVFGVAPYPTLFEKAAALLQSMSRNHQFVDGNKRTALHACLLLLELNGVEPGVPDTDELETFVVNVAIGKIEDVPEIAHALQRLFAPPRLPSPAPVG